MTTEKTQDIRLGKDGASPERNAALRGASMAFGKPPIKPKPLVNTYSGTNGALAAATKVGGSSRPNDISRTSSSSRGDSTGELRFIHQRTGGSNAGSSYTPDIDRRPTHLDPNTGFLQPPELSKSPSFIAASLAASRSVTPSHTGQQQQMPTLQKQLSFTRRQSPGSIRSMSSRGSSDQPLDTSSIAPTTSLIGMFERNAATQSAKKPNSTRAEAAVRNKSPEPQTQAPSPRSAAMQKPRVKPPKPIITPEPSSKPTEPPRLSPSPRKIPTKARPDPPKQVQAVALRKSSTAGTKPIPIPPKPRRRKAENDGTSSDDSFVSANSYRPSFRAELSTRNQRQQASSSPSTTAIESLANAIVASSLASSRAASPSRSNHPPPPPPRRTRTHNLFHHSPSSERTPSPTKPPILRTTMRKPRSVSEDEGEKRRGRKNLMKKHPNKHHEGDRKRWRDVVTERERKRYEAVWASNKGLFTPPGKENCVCNLVVKDIFSRSRLHGDVLEEVYTLVDREKCGVLNKEEFVVGLWLVDQRLKGRKLPIRVSESVWRSVGSSGGIKVRNAGK